MPVPQHRAAVPTETALRGTRLGWLVVLVKGEGSVVLPGSVSRPRPHPRPDRLRLSRPSLQLVLALLNHKRRCVAHDIHASHVSARLAAYAALAELGSVITWCGRLDTW